MIVAKDLLSKSLQQTVCLTDRIRNGRLLMHKVTRKAGYFGFTAANFTTVHLWLYPHPPTFEISVLFALPLLFSYS